MKARLLPSPNHGDALALTFAYPVVAGGRQAVQAEGVDYNPYENVG